MNQEIHLYYTCIIIYVLNSPLFQFILIKAKKPFSFDFNNKKRKRKRKREKACSCLFPIFFSRFFLSIIISNLLKHMKRRQNIEVHTYRNTTYLHYIQKIFIIIKKWFMIWHNVWVLQLLQNSKGKKKKCKQYQKTLSFLYYCYMKINQTCTCTSIYIQ